MNKLFRLLTPFILIAAAVMFTFFGIKGIQNHKTYNTSSGVITSITSETGSNSKDTVHHVFVKYEAQGKQYESELGTYSSSMKEGQDIEIIYNPEAPDEIDDASYLGVIMNFVMAVMALFLFFVVIIRIMKGTY